ncbi:hypothetical protein ACVWY3_004141 [Bradyrhizobium sp. USDA 4486]
MRSSLSRAGLCGGRSSVGREWPGAGRIALREPLRLRVDGRRCQVGLACKFRSPVDRAAKTAAKWRAVRTAKPCGPGRRCYGQALADAAVASTGAMAGDFRESEGGQKELGSRESAAYAVRPSRREGRVIGTTCMLLCGLLCAISRSRPRVRGQHPAFPIGVKVAQALIDIDVFGEARAGAAQALAYCGASGGWLVVE